MEFRCRLITAEGEIVEGVYSAENEGRLRHELEEKGLHVLSLRARGGAVSWLPSLLTRRRIPRHEFLVVNQELATLLKAGMPLVQSLDLLRRQTVNPVFRAVLDAVHEKVRAGTALSDAFGEHGDLFPRVYSASLVAGERSGSLDTVLRRYVAYEKVIDTVKKRTLSALIYPVILIALSIGLVLIIVLRVVPAFSDFYASFGAELPLSTRIIVAISNFVLGQFVILSFALVTGIAAIFAWFHQPGQRVRFDRALLAVPFVGRSFRKFATAQLARTLGTLLGGGIPLVNALDVAARSINNRYMAQELEAVTQRVREGGSLAASLTAHGIVADVAVKMVEVGESTGALQDMLVSLADFYDEEIETEVGRFVMLVEPIILVVMGIVVAGLVLALYMPLFRLSTVI
jgi:type IV pilus assembly protein PilC